MRALPHYPAYKAASPTAFTRWLGAGVLKVLIGGAIAGLLPITINKTSLVAAEIVVAAALTGLACYQQDR